MTAKWINYLIRGIFVLIGLSLLLLSVSMVAMSLISVIQDALKGEFHVSALLDNASIIVISAAVLDLGKFFFEEQVTGGRDMSHIDEVRSSLTKFMTIILIAMSLEGLLMVFEVSTSEQLSELVYPAILFATTISGIVAIGLFQWLTRRAPPIIGRGNAPGRREEETPSSDS
ncbi:hypothetical protein [Sediminicurvatus halobius]|uniref:GNAT family acetyltransferase n=1 Tax=Sediminicurvatus halobius TaxID=2182432 RepID=A0A2U2N9G6_9GAMM|nr:hypothetical protein [Spiribacter halobius]PWG65846.1 hypothetical protein DEM34_00860 [Spiribacter halobius]UEX77891.1 hypothetical protein LMH63_18495 [Spiribacter halobius]